MRCVVMPGFVWIVTLWSLCAGEKLLADQPDSLENLRKLKVAAAQEWCAALAAREEAEGSVNVADIVHAAKALKDAQLDVATSKSERIRALEVYRDRMQSLFEKIDVLSQLGRRGGEAERRAAARVYLLDAKILLEQEEEGKP